jgi:hypothetical protein
MAAFSLAGSPFVALPVLPRSTAEEIEAAYESRREAKPEAEATFLAAKRRLLSREERLGAELAWIIDVGPLTAKVLFEAMAKGDPATLLAALQELPPLTKANVAADACRRLRSTDFVAPLAAAHRSLDLSTVTDLVNQLHAASGAPLVDSAELDTALAILTQAHAAAALEAVGARGNVQEVLSALLRDARGGSTRFLDEVTAQYYQGASQPYADVEAEVDGALARLTDGRDATASEVLEALPKWRALSQPVLRLANGLGVDEPRSLRLYSKIRNACLYIANDRRQASAASEILVALHGAFEDLPSSNADIEADQTFLKKLSEPPAAAEVPPATVAPPAAPARLVMEGGDPQSLFPRSAPRPRPIASRDAIIWGLVGVIVLATLGFLVFQYRTALFGAEAGAKGGVAPSHQTAVQSDAPGPVKEPAPGVSAAQVDQGAGASLLAVIPAGGPTESRPPVSAGALLDRNQLRYCMFNKERLNDVDPTIKTLAFLSKLDAVVADFNARCGHVKYMTDDFKQVSAELQIAQPRLREEAQALSRQWTQ